MNITKEEFVKAINRFRYGSNNIKIRFCPIHLIPLINTHRKVDGGYRLEYYSYCHVFGCEYEHSISKDKIKHVPIQEIIQDLFILDEDEVKILNEYFIKIGLRKFDLENDKLGKVIKRIYSSTGGIKK